MLTLLFHSHSLKLGRIGDDSESVGVRACTGLQCGPIVFIKSKKFKKFQKLDSVYMFPASLSSRL